jgi:fructose/tagatose bisphosphate aldolase
MADTYTALGGSKPVTVHMDHNGAYRAIGANLVQGFTVHRHEVTDRRERTLIVIAIHGSVGTIHGVYTFTR